MDHLDAIILGTGLAESITAAALSKAGYSVGHIDLNSYYGGDDASLTVDELVKWADERTQPEGSDSPYRAVQRKKFTSISRLGSIPPQSRQYAISLAPALVPSVGPLIDSLIASGVSRYGGFKLLERVALYGGSGTVKPVPANKEDVFRNKQLSLLDKRRLMRFLIFAGGEFEDKPELQGNEQMPFPTFLADKFSLNEDAVQAIAYALAFCLCASDPTLPALKRIRRYLRSTGRYGPSPFLIGHYGGAGELAQGFCRTSAVGGATYVLGRQIKHITRTAKSESGAREYTLELDDFGEQLHADVLVSSPDYIPPELLTPISASSSKLVHIAHCVAIIDRPISFNSSTSTPDASEDSQGAFEDKAGPSEPAQNSQVDTALLVFSPGSVPSGSKTAAVNALITGEGSLCAPRGNWVIYISMPLVDKNEHDTRTAEELLRPYLDATLSLTSLSATSERPEHARPLFALFHKQTFPPPPSYDTESVQSTLILSSPYSPYLPESADAAASDGEAMFWKAVKALRAAGRLPHRKREDGAEETDTAIDVESFWPPLDYVEDSDE